MDLFSKIKEWWMRRRPFTEREFHFNRDRLTSEMQRHAVALNEHRNDASHAAFVSYIRALLHTEMLQLSTMPMTTLEAVARQRGKIDALRQVLDLREKFIQDQKEKKKTGKENAVRSYIPHRSPANSAGLSV
jgi:hypothetical protein